LNITRKLEIFAKLAEHEAKRKRQDMQDDLDKRLKESLEQTKKYALESAEKKLELELGKLAGMQKREVARHENEARKKLILRREEILKALFCAVEKMLEEYTDSVEYQEWLSKAVRSELDKNPGAAIVLCQKDYEALGIQEARHSSEITLGGYKLICADGRRVIDNTLEARLALEYENFRGIGSIDDE